MNDKRLIKFVSSFRKGILGKGTSDGMCFAVCAPLVTLLNMSGVKGTLTKGDVEFVPFESNHFWIMLDDGRVIDPTADQFNNRTCRQMPPVYLGPPVPGLHEPARVPH